MKEIGVENIKIQGRVWLDGYVKLGAVGVEVTDLEVDDGFGHLYARAEGGFTELFYKDDDQVEHQLADAAAIITDHGGLTGLGDDDHPQYQKETDFTEGSVLFRGASVIAQDNANFFWDDTNNRLGLGIASPAHQLSIKGAASPNVGQVHLDSNGTGSLDFFTYNADDAEILFDSEYVGGAYVARDTSSFQIAKSSDTLQINGKGSLVVGDPFSYTRFVTIDLGGNVGIGTAAPGLLVDMQAAAAAIQIKSTGSNQAAWLQIRNGSGAGILAYIGVSNSTGSNFFGGDEQADALIFGTASAKCVQIATGAAIVGTYSATGGHFSLGGVAFPGAGTKGLIFNDGTALSSMASNTAGLYADDVGGTVQMFAIDEAGAVVNLMNPPPSGISTGAAPIAGNAALVGGTVTVTTTAAVTASKILLTRKTSGGTIGMAVNYTINTGVSFTITSDNILDTSTYTWVIVQSF